MTPHAHDCRHDRPALGESSLGTIFTFADHALGRVAQMDELSSGAHRSSAAIGLLRRRRNGCMPFAAQMLSGRSMSAAVYQLLIASAPMTVHGLRAKRIVRSAEDDA